ncbi:hypothetical protein C8Q78DRAFT_180830 [Trametes maxima]|nr:hypothetical protein C8Q78DRAFT_180830 [Trametes maxima]
MQIVSAKKKLRPPTSAANENWSAGMKTSETIILELLRPLLPTITRYHTLSSGRRMTPKPGRSFKKQLIKPLAYLQQRKVSLNVEWPLLPAMVVLENRMPAQSVAERNLRSSPRGSPSRGRSESSRGRGRSTNGGFQILSQTIPARPQPGPSRLSVAINAPVSNSLASPFPDAQPGSPPQSYPPPLFRLRRTQVARRVGAGEHPQRKGTLGVNVPAPTPRAGRRTKERARLSRRRLVET